MFRFLLNFLFNHFLFAGTMFFAAGAVADVGAGGGDGSAGSGGVGDGASDIGSADADTDAGTETDTGSGSDDSQTDAEADGGSDPNASVDLGDGRQVPAKFKKLFDVAKAQGLEKEVKQLYFANQRLTKVIPGGVNGAIELARSVENLGGVEGIEQLQSDLGTYQQDSELFERGDPKWIESSFSENPETSLKHFSHALNYIAENHGEFYDHVMAKAMFQTLDQMSPVHEIYTVLSGLKDNPAAQKAAQQLAKWFNGVKDLASKLPEKKVDAQQKTLNDKSAAIEKKEMDLRFSQANSQVAPVMKQSIAKTLQAEAKRAGIDLQKLAADYPLEVEQMVTKIHDSLQQRVLKDARFLDKHFALIKKGDIKRAVAAVNAKHDSLVSGVVQEITGKSGFFKKKSTPGKSGERGGANDTANANAANEGWARVSARPKNADINWSKTTSAMQLDGKYILNDGKKVVVQY